MNIQKLRKLSQDFEYTFRSPADTPLMSYSTVKIPKYKDVIAPVVKKKSLFLKESKKPQGTHSQTGSLERAKVQKFLSIHKQSGKSQFLTVTRDISHLKNKSLGVASPEQKFSAFGAENEKKVWPGLEELAEIGKSDCEVLPKVFIDGEFKGKVLGKEWICGKDVKSVFTRREAGNLKNWFVDMREKISMKDLSSGLLEVKGLILVTIRELYSQISVQCCEHGKIFIELLEVYSKFVDKMMGFKVKVEKMKVFKSFESVSKKLKGKIQDLNEKIKRFEVEKQEFAEKEKTLQVKMKSLEEDLNFHRELNRSPVRGRNSTGLNNSVYSLSKFAESLKKKFGEIGDPYDNIVEVRAERNPLSLRTSSYAPLHYETIEGELNLSSVSSVSSKSKNPISLFNNS